MSKPILGINKGNMEGSLGTLGMNEMLQYLIDSDLFDIKYHEEYLSTPVKAFRATIIHYNDKKVYFDLWDYSNPTITTDVYNYGFDLIIKLQKSNMSKEHFERQCQRDRFMIDKTADDRWAFYNKIVPWTFFPSRMMKQFVGKEDTLEKLPIERFGFFCGKFWKCRHGIWKKLEQEGVELVQSSQELRRGRPLTDDQYIHKMRTSKYGIILHGRGSHFSEAKNRREIDYMILKKPMLLNYQPNYYDPLINGKHYIYFNGNTDFKELEVKYNIDEIAQNAYEWYKNNASPMGAAKTFLRIMQERFG